MSWLIFNGWRSFAPENACGFATAFDGVIGLYADKPPPPLIIQASLPLRTRRPVGTGVRDLMSFNSPDQIVPEIASDGSIGSWILKLRKLDGCESWKFIGFPVNPANARRSWKKPGTPGKPAPSDPRTAVAA